MRFIALTGGDSGNQNMSGGMLAKRRRKEAEESGRRLGLSGGYIVWDMHDGGNFPFILDLNFFLICFHFFSELESNVHIRYKVIKAIREWKADVVISPRAEDYHPGSK